MLTRLQVQGFKNLLDVDVRFGPFTCIFGENGTGKSNLFDAIRFLHLLTRFPIMEAAQRLREAKGRSPEPRALFASFGSYRAPEIRFSADMMIDREVQDDFGVTAQAAISTVRYTVRFRLAEDEKPERLVLASESLEPIALASARKEIGFKKTAAFTDSAIKGRRVGLFISTIESEGGPEIRVHQEGHGGRRVPAPKSSRTVLGGLASSDFPTLLAVHREMESWQTLLLEPSAMRAPSFYSDRRFIDERGANVPAAVERMRRLETTPGQVYASLSNRLALLLDEVQDVEVLDDEKTETLTLRVRGKDQVFHAARSLSDGTLRFIALTALAIDPETTGLICLEEPENGIHPERIEPMVGLLKDIAVDPSYALGPDNPLRQVLVNTHSPAVLENIDGDEVVYITMENAVRDNSLGQVSRILVPPKSWRAVSLNSKGILGPGHVSPYFTRFVEKNLQQLQLHVGI